MEGKKLIKLSNGDIKEMTCGEVYEQFKKFLYKTAYKWSYQYSVEDIFQITAIALVKAYNSYDANKEILFMTYMATIVNNEIRMYHRKNKKHSEVKSLDCTIKEDKDGSSMALIDLISDDSNYEESVINKVDVNNLLYHLTPREKMVMECFISGDSQRKTAKKLRMGTTTVNRLIHLALNKMKNYYESEEFNVNVNSRKECFKYFSENDAKEKSELISDVVKKYGCTEGTAENYYYTWKSQYMGNKDMSKVRPKGEIKVKDLIREPQMVKKSTYEKVKEFKPKNGVLQATNLRGKIMCYNLYDNGNGFYMKRPNGNTVMPIEFAEVDDLIKELQAVKRAGD